MAALPENWEWDYDGKRWFYRYKPTGIIQYTFPKPGDEFPEYVDECAAPINLPPEEKLVSQQQLKRKTIVGDSPGQPASGTKQRDRATSNVSSEQDDGGGPFWLQPDGLMYMGPGAYNDISPLHEEEEERGPLTSKADEAKADDGKTGDGKASDGTAPSPAGTAATPATAASSPGKGPAARIRSQISPLTSTETTPQVPNSEPAAPTPEIDSAVVIEAAEPIQAIEPPATIEVIETVPADVVIAELPHSEIQPEIPLLDSREVSYNPLGVVAELASELTARCEEEINPTPVELPSNEMMIHITDPELPYANAFHLPPVELASDEVPAGRRAARAGSEQKSLASQTILQKQEHQQKAQQAVKELLNRPYRPVRENSMPQTTSAVPESSMDVPESIPSKYQPYNPARQAVLRASAGNRHSIIETGSLEAVKISENKRHSLAGPALRRFPPDVPAALTPPHVPPKRPLEPSDMPAALMAPHVPPKRPLDAPDVLEQIPIPGSSARHESISGPLTQTASGGLANFPSVLQPARGRPPARTQSPPKNPVAGPAPTYQAYKPSRDLQREIDDTVQLLSRTGYGQATTATTQTSDPERPQVLRTGTLPMDLPALPYMGVRPQLPHSTASEPLSLRGRLSQQAGFNNLGPSSAAGGAAQVPTPQGYSAPLPPTSPDLPQPLNLSRKPPLTQSIVPTAVTPSARPAVSPEHHRIAPQETAAAPPGPTVVPFPAALNTISEADPKSRTLASMLSVEDVKHGREHDVRSTTAGGQPEQAVSAGFSVTTESSMPPASHPSAAVPSSTTKHKSSAEPTLASSAVEVADVQPASHSKEDASALLEHAAPPVEVSSNHQVSGMQSAASGQQPGPSASKMVPQETSPPATLQSSVVMPGPTRNSLHITSDQQSVIHTQHELPPQDSTIAPTEQTVADQPSSVRYATPGPATGIEHRSLTSTPGKSLDARQQVTPPGPSVSPRPPSPRTPSPLSRASSPPTQDSSAQTSMASVRPPATGLVSLQASRVSLGQNDNRAPRVDLQPSPMASSSSLSSNAKPVASDEEPVYTIPAGHHPLGSHPVNISQSHASGKPASVGSARSSTGDADSQRQQPSDASSRTASGTHSQIPLASQHHTRNTQILGASSQQNLRAMSVPVVPHLPATSSSQGPGVPVPAARHVQQSATMYTTGAGQEPQGAFHRAFSEPVGGHPGQPMHFWVPGPGGAQNPVMFVHAMPPGVPLQSGQPSMLPQQQYILPPGAFIQSGMQGMPHQMMAPHMMQATQMMPTAAHVMHQQPAQAASSGNKEEKGWFGRLWRSDSVGKRPSTGPAAAAATAGGASNQPNRLHKGGTSSRNHLFQQTQSAQPPLVLPPELHPDQPVPSPAPQYVPPQGLMMQLAQQVGGLQQQPQQQQQPPQQGQQQRPQQQPQQQQQQQQRPHHHQQQQQTPSHQGAVQPPQQSHHHHQQQQQHHQQQPQNNQPLTWKTVSAADGDGITTKPLFHAPNPDPNRAVIPPPDVRRAMQQQEQRLGPTQQMRTQGPGPGPGKMQGPGQMPVGGGVGVSGLGGSQSMSGEGGAGVGQPAQRHSQGGKPEQRVGVAAAGGGGGGGGWGGASASAAGYDGSGYDGSGYDGEGWGDEEGEYK